MNGALQNFVPAVFLLATALSLFLAAYAWVHRGALRGAGCFALLMFSVSIWLFTGLMEDTAGSMAARIRWSQAQYIGIVSVAPFWLLFALERNRAEAGAPLARRTWWIWPFPLAVFALALTHTSLGHGLVWTRIAPLTADPAGRLVYAHGPVVWVLALYSYLLVLSGSALLVQQAFRSDVLYRRQVLLLVIAALLPVAGNVVYLSGLSPLPAVDLTPLAMAISGIFLALGVFHYRLLSIGPVAMDALFRDMVDGAIVVDDAEQIREMNPAARRMLGLAPSAAGKSASEVLAPWPPLQRLASLTAPPSAPQPFDMVSPNGSGAAHATVLGHPRDPSGRLILLRDLSTERESLHALQRRDAILEAVRVSADTLLREAPVERVIPRVLQRIGDAVGADWAFVQPFADRTGTRKTMQVWRRASGANRPGASILAEDWLALLRRGRTLALDGAKASGADRQEMDKRGIRSLLAVPVRAREDGWGAIGFGVDSEPRTWAESDIDALRTAAQTLGAALEREEAEAEQHKLREQLFDAQKMESIGRLAGGIAHDFNNLLQTILGFSEVLVSSLPADDRRRSDLQEIEGAAQRGALLTQQLLAFGRKQLIRLESLDLNALLQGLEGMLRRTAGERIAVRLDLDPFLHPVQADAGPLSQVIMNLVVNARDAMPQGGRLTLQTRRIEVMPDTEGKPPEAKPGSYVAVSVADTGLGIPPDVRPHIFEPFYSTKRDQPGAGMGLPTTYGIARQHGGWVSVASEPGRGTTVQICLPMEPPEAATAGESPTVAPTVAHGPLRVLILEDEPSVRKLAERLLVNAGYAVETAASVEEAQRLFDRPDRPFDLLFTDVVLPDGNGLDLATAQADRQPGLRVLVTTGYAGDRTSLPAAEHRGWPVLRKPWLPARLLRSLEEITQKTE